MAMNKIPCGGFYLDNSLTVDYIDNKPILKTAVGGGTKKEISKVNISLEPSVEAQENVYFSYGYGYGFDLIETKKYIVTIDDTSYDVTPEFVGEMMALTNVEDRENIKVGDWIITGQRDRELLATLCTATEGEIHSMSVSGEIEKIVPIESKFTTKMLTFEEIEVTDGDYTWASAEGRKLKFVGGDYVTADDIKKSDIIDWANCVFYIPYSESETEEVRGHIGDTMLRFKVDDSAMRINVGALNWSSTEYQNNSNSLKTTTLHFYIDENNEVVGSIYQQSVEIPVIGNDNAGHYEFTSWSAQASCVQAVESSMGELLISKSFSATSSSGGTYVLTDDEQHDYRDLRKAITDNRISWAGMSGDTTRSAVLAEYDNHTLVYTYYKIPLSTGTPVTVFTYNAKTKTLSFSYDTGLYIDYFKFGRSYRV